MPHISKLHLTTLDERSKAQRKREPATGSEHLLVGMKIVIPVLPSIGAYISDDARSCVNDDYFDLPSFWNRKFQSEKKSDIGDFAPSRAKTAALYEKLITCTSRGIGLGKYLKRWPMLKMEIKGVFLPVPARYIFSFSIIFFFQNGGCKCPPPVWRSEPAQ